MKELVVKVNSNNGKMFGAFTSADVVDSLITYDIHISNIEHRSARCNKQHSQFRLLSNNKQLHTDHLFNYIQENKNYMVEFVIFFVYNTQRFNCKRKFCFIPYTLSSWVHH